MHPWALTFAQKNHIRSSFVYGAVRPFSLLLLACLLGISIENKVYKQTRLQKNNSHTSANINRSLRLTLISLVFKTFELYLNDEVRSQSTKTSPSLRYRR